MEDKIILNKYGRIRLKFLKENKNVEYTKMLIDGTLRKHLLTIQDESKNKIEYLIEELKKKNNLSEELKNTDPLSWVRYDE